MPRKFLKLVIVLFFFTILGCGQNSKTTDLAPITKELKSEKAKDFSIIKCPFCNFTKQEKLPTDVCLIKYECTNCKKEIFPIEGDCCVFCSYGDHKCPSKQ